MHFRKESTFSVKLSLSSSKWDIAQLNIVNAFKLAYDIIKICTVKQVIPKWYKVIRQKLTKKIPCYMGNVSIRIGWKITNLRCSTHILWTPEANKMEKKNFPWYCLCDVYWPPRKCCGQKLCGAPSSHSCHICPTAE